MDLVPSSVTLLSNLGWRFEPPKAYPDRPIEPRGVPDRWEEVEDQHRLPELTQWDCSQKSYWEPISLVECSDVEDSLRLAGRGGISSPAVGDAVMMGLLRL